MEQPATVAAAAAAAAEAEAAAETETEREKERTMVINASWKNLLAKESYLVEQKWSGHHSYTAYVYTSSGKLLCKIWTADSGFYHLGVNVVKCNLGQPEGPCQVKMTVESVMEFIAAYENELNQHKPSRNTVSSPGPAAGGGASVSSPAVTASSADATASSAATTASSASFQPKLRE